MFYTPIRRNAFTAEPRNIDRAFERMLSNAFQPFSRQSTAQAPRLTQEENGVNLSLDVPGLSREQISIHIEANTLRLESVKDAPRSFKLAYEFTFDIDAEASKAKLENGVLSLTLIRQPATQNAKSLVIS